MKSMLCVCVCLCAWMNSSADDYRLVWSDEFDIDGLPGAHWNYEYGFVRNNELQWYQPDNAEVRDGCLVITGRLDSIPNPYYDAGSDDWRKRRPAAYYSSSCLTTSDSFNFMYGRMEVRARIPLVEGAWPAIWTLGNRYAWPSNGEIDLMEFYRRDEPIILANACWKGDNGTVEWDESTTKLSYFLEKDPLWGERFHVWRMDWTPENIRLYLDDELLNDIPLSQSVSGGGESSNLNPFANEEDGFGHYILLNLALGGQGGVPADDQFPLRYEIDYVRVYQK